MKTYVIRFSTNYGEAAIIITTAHGEEYAKMMAVKMGAWDGYSVEEIKTEEGACCSVNFEDFSGII